MLFLTEILFQIFQGFQITVFPLFVRIFVNSLQFTTQNGQKIGLSGIGSYWKSFTIYSIYQLIIEPRKYLFFFLPLNSTAKAVENELVRKDLSNFLSTLIRLDDM